MIGFLILLLVGALVAIFMVKYILGRIFKTLVSRKGADFNLRLEGLEYFK